MANCIRRLYAFATQSLVLLALLHAPPSYSGEFSSDDCLERSFPNAKYIRKSMWPPEVILYCAYPWNEKKFATLAAELLKAGVKHDSIAVENTKLTEAKRAVLAEGIRLKYSLSYPDLLRNVMFVSEYMPHVWAAGKGNSSVKAWVKSSFTPDFVIRLTQAAAGINWDDSLIQNGVIHGLPLSGGRVRFLTSAFDRVTLTDMVTLRLTHRAAAQESMFEKDSVASTALFIRGQELVASGLSIHHASVVVLVEAYIGLLEAEGNRIRGDEDVPVEWKPLKRERTQDKPLSIYWTQSAPQGWCNGDPPRGTGQYCEATDSVYARPTEPRLGDRSPLAQMGFPLFHEIGHAFLNPAGAADSPFITEGVITSLGEVQSRAVSAAQAAFQSLTKEQSDVTNLVLGGGDISDSTYQAALAISTEKIQAEPLSSYSKSALCRTYVTPLTVERLISWLSKSVGSFQSLEKEEQQLGYAHGWALYHFGLDLSKVTQTTTFSQLDASAIQLASSKLLKNQDLSANERDSLTNLVSRVTRSVNEQGVSICKKQLK